MVSLSLLLATLLADIGPEPRQVLVAVACPSLSLSDIGATDDEDDLPDLAPPQAVMPARYAPGPARQPLEAQSYLRRSIQILYGVWVC